jgi:hypothetical protein
MAIIAKGMFIKCGLILLTLSYVMIMLPNEDDTAPNAEATPNPIPLTLAGNS